MISFFKQTRFWIGLFCILLLLCIGITGFWWLSQPGKSTCRAILSQNGEILQTIPLDRVTKEYTLTISNDNGGTNTIAIAPGKIRVLEASCPDQFCVQQGWIQNSIYPIVCLPNQLVIRIESDDYSAEQSALDIVAQ